LNNQSINQSIYKMMLYSGSRTSSSLFLLALLGIACHVMEQASAFVAMKPTPRLVGSQSAKTTTILHEMKRPILDQIATTLFKLENDRVEASSVVDEKGRMGEPMEWSEGSSFANKFSEIIAGNSLGYQFKQWVADIVAGDFDKETVDAKIDAFVGDNSVAMFSFSTCPFCRKAKDFLEEKGVDYKVIELDELDGNQGNEIRAMLGKRTKRTSVPSMFIGGKYIGGCNDGPGLMPLAASGELDTMLAGL
jgi:glutaredoxin 3